MKYLVYFILLFIAGLLFLPRTGTTEIRNKPLLIFVIFLIVIRILIRFFKYVLLMVKARRLLKQNKKKVIHFIL